PGLVAEALDVLVFGDASKSLTPPAGESVERSHCLMCVGGSCVDAHVEVGQLVVVLPLVPSLSDRDDVRQLPLQLDEQRVGGLGFCQRVRRDGLLWTLWPNPAWCCGPDIGDPGGISDRKDVLVLLVSTAAGDHDRRG